MATSGAGTGKDDISIDSDTVRAAQPNIPVHALLEELVALRSRVSDLERCVARRKVNIYQLEVRVHFVCA